MSDIFKDGSVPFPDYDREDTDNFTRKAEFTDCLLYTSPSPRDLSTSRMPSSA